MDVCDWIKAALVVGLEYWRFIMLLGWLVVDSGERLLGSAWRYVYTIILERVLSPYLPCY